MSHPLVILISMGNAISVSCGDCVMQNTDHCSGCLVTFLCSREPDDAVIINAAEERAVRLLAKAGLVPEIKHVSIDQHAV